MIFELYDIEAFLDCLLCSLHITTSKVTPSEPTFSITAAPTSVRSPLITPAQRTPTLRVRVRHFRQRTRTALPSATNMWSTRARFCDCLDGLLTPRLKELMIHEESSKHCACGGVDCAAGARTKAPCRPRTRAHSGSTTTSSSDGLGIGSGWATRRGDANVVDSCTASHKVTVRARRWHSYQAHCSAKRGLLRRYHISHPAWCVKTA